MSETSFKSDVNTEKLKQEIQRRIDAFLSIGVELIATKVREEAPFREGHLRNSTYTHYERGDELAYVYNSADYFTYVEFGTKFMSANPFMSRGMRLAEPHLRALLERLKIGT